VGGLIDVVKSPAYATAVGLLHYGLKQGREGRSFSVDPSSIKERVFGFFKELF
jgi:cell division ATPase FtsA